MIEVEWWEFDDSETLANEVAGDIGFIIERAIETNGKAELALPGGRTPVPILETLARRDFDWSRVRVFPTNERIVPVGSEHSNFEMLQRILGVVGTTVEPLIDHAQNWSVKEAGQSADARLAGFSWPVDMVWIGMDSIYFPRPDGRCYQCSQKSARSRRFSRPQTRKCTF